MRLSTDIHGDRGNGQEATDSEFVWSQFGDAANFLSSVYGISRSGLLPGRMRRLKVFNSMDMAADA